MCIQLLTWQSDCYCDDGVSIGRKETSNLSRFKTTYCRGKRTHSGPIARVQANAWCLAELHPHPIKAEIKNAESSSWAKIIEGQVTDRVTGNI